MADSLETARKPAPLSVIVPIFNEEPGLSQFLEQALLTLSASGFTCEVLIVAAESLVATVSNPESFPSVRLISPELGYAWGDAILAASAQAQHDLICTIDVPTLHAAAEIPRLVQALEAYDAAMAVGVRIGIQKPIPARRRILPWLVDMLASDALGRPLPDINSGFRVFRREHLQAIANGASSGPILPAALTLKMIAAKATILFVPFDVERGSRTPHHGRARETLQLIRLIIAAGLEHSPGRTLALIGRMTLMMLMMAAMMLMMLWMMGMLPGL